MDTHWEPRWIVIGERADGTRVRLAFRMEERRALTIGRMHAVEFPVVLVALVRSGLDVIGLLKGRGATA